MTDPTDDAGALTIDELAREVGMTVRNVRAHQSRGLLPPPELRGRTGFYRREHVARLELVKDLQAEGFNLEAIKRILERAPEGTLDDVLTFTRQLTGAFVEEPEIRPGAELLAPFGDEATPELLERLVKIGVFRPLPDGTVEVLSPRLQRAAEELADLGVSFKTLVETCEAMHKGSQQIAKAYVKLFLREVWRPFVEAGEPEEQWPGVREALDRLRPVASEATLGLFLVVMGEQVEEAMGRELARMSGQKKRG